MPGNVREVIGTREGEHTFANLLNLVIVLHDYVKEGQKVPLRTYTHEVSLPTFSRKDIKGI